MKPEGFVWKYLKFANISMDMLGGLPHWQARNHSCLDIFHYIPMILPYYGWFTSMFGFIPITTVSEI